MSVKLKNLLICDLTPIAPSHQRKLTGVEYDKLLKLALHQKLSEKVFDALLYVDNQSFYAGQTIQLKEQNSDCLLAKANDVVFSEFQSNKKLKSSEYVKYQVMKSFTCSRTRVDLSNSLFFCYHLKKMDEKYSKAPKTMLLYQKKKNGVVRIWTTENEKITGICTHNGALEDQFGLPFVSNLTIENRIVFNVICDAYGFQLMESDRIKINTIVTRKILQTRHESVHIHDVPFLTLELSIHEKDQESFMNYYDGDSQSPPESKQIQNLPVKLTKYEGIHSGNAVFKCVFDAPNVTDDDSDSTSDSDMEG